MSMLRGLSGNLDPFVALLSTDQLTGSRAGEFNEEVKLAIENNRDPLLVVSEFSDRNFLAWDDDSGGGFAAAFEYTIPTDGDLRIWPSSVHHSPKVLAIINSQLD